MHGSGGNKGGSIGGNALDGGWGWVVVFASFMIHVIADGVSYTFGIFFVELSSNLNASKSGTSWISSIMTGMTYASGPIAGAFVNKWGCRPVSILGSIIAATGFGISYFAEGVTYLYFSIGLLGGFGLGLIYLPAIVSVTCYFEEKRAFATGIAVCGSGVGTFIFAPLMERLIREYGWRLTLSLITSGILIHCALFSILFRPLPEKKSKEITSPISIFRANSNKSNQISQPLSLEFKPQPHESGEPLISQQSIHTDTDTQGPFLNLPKEDPIALSSSHPVLPVVNNKENTIIRRHSLNKGSSIFTSTQLITNRKDIFYSGSIPSINQQLTRGGGGGIERDDEKEIKEDDIIKVENILKGMKKKPWFWEIKGGLLRMMDLSILKNPLFIFFAISNFLTSIGYNIPYIYIADMAIENGGGISKGSAGFLISIIGISNTLSRIILGWASDKPCINRLFLYNSALVIAGISTGIVSHVTSILWLRVYGIVFGVSVGVLVSLTSVILVDLLGLEKLTNAFGLLLLFQGIASLIGPPLVGFIFDEWKDYRGGFWLAGGLMALSGGMLFFIPFLKKSMEKPKLSNHQKQQHEHGLRI